MTSAHEIGRGLREVRVLVGCEFSGIVRDAFIDRGHDAVSCDLLPTERPGPHIQGDVLDVLNDGWDLMIAHPPCRYLSRSGARWWAGREAEQAEALEFFQAMLEAPIARIAVENPIGRAWRIRRPDQVVQPWYFGHGETKATCLWLKNLPPLLATDVMTERSPRVHYERPGADRWMRRSRTYPGLAAAMAEQWGDTEESRGPRPLPIYRKETAVVTTNNHGQRRRV